MDKFSAAKNIRRTGAGTLAVLLLLGSSYAEARMFNMKRDRISEDGTLVVESQSGGDTVTTHVRHNRFGKLEVYVPNWGWEQCGPTCTYTVQKYGTDFWEEQTNGIGVGYLSLDLFR